MPGTIAQVHRVEDMEGTRVEDMDGIRGEEVDFMQDTRNLEGAEIVAVMAAVEVGTRLVNRETTKLEIGVPHVQHDVTERYQRMDDQN
jgi:hypothetical protein